MTAACVHIDEIREVRPESDGCVDCLQVGGRWLHLRLCMTCGHVACCDSSPNRHASKHAAHAQHPIVKSFEPGEDWGWCYADEVWLDEPWKVDGPQFHG
jgi:hypothetical protein